MASVEQLELCLPLAEDELNAGDRIEPRPGACSSLMARVLERENLVRALKQVKRNKGAPGVDGVTVDAFPDYLKHYWASIRAQLEYGSGKAWTPSPTALIIWQGAAMNDTPSIDATIEAAKQVARDCRALTGELLGV